MYILKVAYFLKVFHVMLNSVHYIIHGGGVTCTNFYLYSQFITEPTHCIMK